MDIPRRSIAPDLSHRSEKSTLISYQGEADVKGTSHAAQEFEAETSQLRPNNRESDFQSRHKESFLHWAPVIVATNPLTSEDDPIKSDITARAQDGSTGSSDGQKPSQSDGSSPTNKDKQPATPVRPKKQNVFIPWTPSPKKETHTQSPGASNISPRAGPSVRYSSRELDEGPAFIKALIEAGKSWEEQEELYASKFGISRSQFRLMKKFDLLGMKDGGFEKAAFKNRSENSKPQV
jgi:hypothetical protein